MTKDSLISGEVAEEQLPLYTEKESLELEAFFLQEEILGLARQAVTSAEISRKLSSEAHKAVKLVASLSAESAKIRLKIRGLEEKFEMFKLEQDDLEQEAKKELDKLYEKK